MFRKIFGAALISSAVIAMPAIAGPGGHGGMGMPGGMSGIRAGPSMSMRPMTAPPRMTTNSRTTMNSHMMARPSVRGMRMHNRMALRARSRTNLAMRASKSQGLQHASITAIEHASPHSVLARSSVRSSALPGLTTGLMVKGTGGTTIGTVSRVVTGTDGRIRLVVATSTTGRMIRLAPNTLTISGGIVTTTMV